MKRFVQMAVALILASGALATAQAAASEEDHSRGFFSRSKEFVPVSSPAYKEECSSCHFAYPPGLLPEASWKKLLAPSALEDHFGENIEMKEALRQELLAYAVRNAAEHSDAKRAKKVLASLDGATPEKISEVPYIRRKHMDIPAEQIKGNPKVGSIAQCDACHTEAAKGSFDDDTVVIPGHGRWRW